MLDRVRRGYNSLAKFGVAVLLVLLCAMCQTRSGQTAQSELGQQAQSESGQSDSVGSSAGEILFTASNSNDEKLVFALRYDSISAFYKLYCNDRQLVFVNKAFSDAEGATWDESDIICLVYFLSPDKKHLFTALKPSLAGSCDIFFKVHIYRIDIETLDVTWIANCGAVMVTENGFTTAEQVARLNPDASCAEARFTARHVDFDYNGGKVGESKAMSGESVMKIYKMDYDFDGFGAFELSPERHNSFSVW